MFTVCVCVFIAVCGHFGGVKCRARIPSMDHHTWPYVTFTSLFFRSIIYLFDVRPPLSLDTKIKAFCFTLTTKTYLTIVVKTTYSVKFEVVHSLEKATDTKYQGFFFYYCFVLPM